jgi:hypothetical protein
VNLELVRFCQVDFGQKCADIVPLISLQLNNFTILGMVNNSSVTGKLLLASLDYFSLVVIITDSLDGSQHFSTATLLDSDMNQSLLVALIIGLVCICEWIELLQVLYVHDRDGCNDVDFGRLQ